MLSWPAQFMHPSGINRRRRFLTRWCSEPMADCVTFEFMSSTEARRHENTWNDSLLLGRYCKSCMVRVPRLCWLRACQRHSWMRPLPDDLARWSSLEGRWNSNMHHTTITIIVSLCMFDACIVDACGACALKLCASVSGPKGPTLRPVAHPDRGVSRCDVDTHCV